MRTKKDSITGLKKMRRNVYLTGDKKDDQGESPSKAGEKALGLGEKQFQCYVDGETVNNLIYTTTETTFK